MHRPRSAALAPLALLILVALPGRDAEAARSLADYRYFRALSIDLVGRMPTRDEVAAFEKDDFNLDGWIDEQLQGAGYAERLRRIYMDLLRLELSSAFQYVPSSTTLRRQLIKGPGGKDIYVYFRQGQRRTREETDGEFCMTKAETGLQFPKFTQGTGTPIAVSQAVLDANTTTVKPWWLYRDYQAATPSDRYADTWAMRFPGFVPADSVLKEPDDTPTSTVIVCKEEALTAATGTVYKTGRMAPPAGMAPPYGRLTQLPTDSGFAKAHGGEPISCQTGSAFGNSADCGCGKGLEQCMPADGPGFDPKPFVFPNNAPIGLDRPFDQSQQSQSAWQRLWWSQEVIQFFDHVFGSDRDFREVLTARYSFVNGPLVQFYKTGSASSTCCVKNNAYQFGYIEPEPLLDPAGLPDLLPHDVGTWQQIPDRGDKASGILTMPIFLTKYGSRRGKAHVLYNAFLCRDFVAGAIELKPSTEPNLMIRDGCATCHATLEPLAAYFARIVESDWTYLPADKFPLQGSKCANADPTRIPSYCANFYDPAFTTAESATLRAAYASSEHAEAGPAGFASALTSSPEFPSCIAENVAGSFIGRPLTSDDDVLRGQLVAALTGGNFQLRGMVRALVKSDAYKKANALSSAAVRGGTP